jgi:hypothetical protein
MRREKFLKVWWFFFFAVVSLPLLNHCTGIIFSNRLNGDYDLAKDTTFSKQGWWTGGYQEQKDKYLKDNMGFRPDFVRLGRQIDYTLFRESSGKFVGKGGYLFLDEYIYAFLGKDFMGYDSIKKVVQKMQYVQQSFEQEGKTFLLTVAGSKPEYYPERLPKWPGNKKLGPTNREVFAKYCKQYGVNFIDFNDMLWEIKKTNDGPIYAKQSIHWTIYGATFAVDSAIRFIERERNIDLPNPDFSQLIYVDKALDKTDVDLGENLNLAIPIQENFIYPVIKVPRTATTTSMSTIYIGDSFFWLMQADSLAHVNHDYQFWHYFKDVFIEDKPQHNECIAQIKDYNWRAKIDSTDCVMIVYTPLNLKRVGVFIDSVYTYYKEKERIAARKPKATKAPKITLLH